MGDELCWTTQQLATMADLCQDGRALALAWNEAKDKGRPRSQSKDLSMQVNWHINKCSTCKSALLRS